MYLCRYFLGYHKTPKYCEWVPNLSQRDVKRIECESKSAEELAKGLFMKIFEKELDTHPDEICASSTRLGEGKEQCNPEMLRAIGRNLITNSNIVRLI